MFESFQLLGMVDIVLICIAGNIFIHVLPIVCRSMVDHIIFECLLIALNISKKALSCMYYFSVRGIHSCCYVI